MSRKKNSESFFIRASVMPDDDGVYTDTAIDLSAYVDALGKSILEIKSIEGEWAAGSTASGTGIFPNGAPFMDGNKAGSAVWQLTTQRQVGLVGVDKRTVIAKCKIWARNPDSAANPPAQVYQDSHLPQHYSSSFLVATEQIFLGAQAENEWTEGSDLTFNIVLECSVSTMTSEKAMALALSQQ